MTGFYEADLRLFDGAGDGAGTAASGEGNTPAAAAQEEKAQVVYGKQPEAAPETDAQGETEEKQATPEERRKAYNDLINSAEYKEFYTEDTQRIINKRFKETKSLEEKVAKQQSVIDAVARRYNLKAADADAVLSAIENDTSYYEQAAYEAGMTVEQYAAMEKLKRDNARLAAEQAQREEKERVDSQVRQWVADAETVKAHYPDFDLNALLPQEPGGETPFTRLLKAGVSMEHAYRVINMDRLMADATRQTAALTEKAVVDSVRAKGARPAENGAAPRSAFVVKSDVSKLTKEDRATIALKAMRGEHIEF